MSSFDTRNNSALMKRAEQLRRWEESDTNREPSIPKEKGRKIKFSSGCVFLAACLAGDKDEVVKLIESGADINTANVDGLTALHQACIDDNLEMVEFLLDQGADINRQDNEGWTPLHATASCGFVSIARHLVEHDADLTIVNSDGDLAVDIAPPKTTMLDYLQDLFEENGVDCEKYRQLEEQLMLADAKKWLRSDASEADKPHAKTGATALHVAAAKGYTKVLSLLLAGRANVDKQDNDGWTPLHAASHWGQREAAEMLVDAMADMDVRNYSGQTCIEVADERKMMKFMEELRANNKRIKRRPSSQIRISDTNNLDYNVETTPAKVIRVEVKSDTKETSLDDAEDETNNDRIVVESDETDSDCTDSTESSHSTSVSEDEITKPTSESVKSSSQDTVEEDAPWRRSSSVRARIQPENPPPKIQVPDVKQIDSDVILRRTQSFENDEKFYQKYHELRARIKANSCPILPATQTTGVLGAVNSTSNSYSVQRSASLKDHRNFRKPPSPPVSPSTPAAAPTTGVRRSFVPPVRDEESETQRKAHAKRVRETRRSTQGVTLDEIKSAEELVKKKNLNINNNNNSATESQITPSQSSSTTSTISTTTTSAIETTTPSSSPQHPPPLTSSTTTTTNSSTNDRISNEPALISIIDLTKPDSDKQITTASLTISSPKKLKDIKKYNNDDNDDDNDNDNDDDNVFKESKKNDDRLNNKLTIIDDSNGTKTNDEFINSSNIVINVPNLNSNSDGSSNNRSSSSSTSSSNINKTDDQQPHQHLNDERNKTELNDTTTSDRDSIVIENIGNLKSEIITTPTPIPTIRIREKRSLFDIDNANSLTLADKLRNEANKYNDEHRQTNNDITSGNLIKLNDDTENLTNNCLNSNSNDNRKSESSNPSSPQHNQINNSSNSSNSVAERRPSWRLKFDAGSKFKLEDASTGSTFPPNNSTIITSAPAVIAAANLSLVGQRRNNTSAINTNSQQQQQPTQRSTPITSTTITAENLNDRIRGDSNNEVTVTLRRNKNSEDKENDKENDSRSAQTTQAVLQRRRKPKRRSTGVVHVDMDDIDPDKQDSPGDNEEKESGNERSSRSRLGGSTNSLVDTENSDNKTINKDSSENGELIDYKALWESVKIDNDKLKKQLKGKDDELLSAKSAIDRFTNATTKNSISELEKRERRAMERKLSEMEEELKLMEILKTENQRLKEENGALIRVISKLSK